VSSRRRYVRGYSEDLLIFLIQPTNGLLQDRDPPSKLMASNAVNAASLPRQARL